MHYDSAIEARRSSLPARATTNLKHADLGKNGWHVSISDGNPPWAMEMVLALLTRTSLDAKSSVLCPRLFDMKCEEQ